MNDDPRSEREAKAAMRGMIWGILICSFVWAFIILIILWIHSR